MSAVEAFEETGEDHPLFGGEGFETPGEEVLVTRSKGFYESGALLSEVNLLRSGLPDTLDVANGLQFSDELTDVGCGDPERCCDLALLERSSPRQKVQDIKMRG